MVFIGITPQILESELAVFSGVATRRIPRARTSVTAYRCAIEIEGNLDRAPEIWFLEIKTVCTHNSPGKSSDEVLSALLKKTKGEKEPCAGPIE